MSFNQDSSNGATPDHGTPERFFMPLIGAYDWLYGQGDVRNTRLYELAKNLSWDADKDIDWQAAGSPLFNRNMPATQRSAIDAWLNDSSPWRGFEPYRRMPQAEKFAFYQREHVWHINQFRHGEQGALLVSAQLCVGAPTLDAKLFAASQVSDEARHVEFFTKYLQRSFPYAYPVSARLKSLLNAIMASSQWDIKLIGMQVIIEGLALASFRIAVSESHDPVLKQGLQLILRDESRHTNFGFQYVQDFLTTLAPHDMTEREDFAADACALARDLMLPTPVFTQCGWPVDAAETYARENGVYAKFHHALFAIIVPELAVLGLIPERLSARYRE